MIESFFLTMLKIFFEMVYDIHFYSNFPNTISYMLTI